MCVFQWLYIYITLILSSSIYKVKYSIRDKKLSYSITIVNADWLNNYYYFNIKAYVYIYIWSSYTCIGLSVG